MKRSFPIPWILFIFLTAMLACTLTGPRGEPTPTAAPATASAPTPYVEPSAIEVILPTPSETPTSPPTETLTESPAHTPTETATPLPQVTPTPTFTPLPDLSRIRFETGGTWAEVVGAGQENKLTTFVLRALQGQVMSVSVFEGPGYVVTIAGADGQILTPSNRGDYFWRGLLPATQDYLVSVQAPRAGAFTLRIAVNPPGQSEQTFAYSNDVLGVRLEYSDSFSPVDYPYAFLQRDDFTLALNVLEMQFYENTNLSEAFFVLNVFDNPGIVATCYQAYYEPEQVEGPVTINGIVFEKSLAVGVAAGNIYEQIIYRTVQKDVCMEVVFFMHSGNIGNYTPGTVTEFNREELLERFEEVLGTLRLE